MKVNIIKNTALLFPFQKQRDIGKRGIAIMATIREDGYIQSLSDKDLQKKFRETIRDINMYTLRLEHSNDLLALLEAELIKRSILEIEKTDESQRI